jgi:hypothetical protein
VARKNNPLPSCLDCDNVLYDTLSMDSLKLTPDTRLQPAPARSAFDYGLAIAQVGAIAFPFVGAGVKLFDLVTAPLRGKRMSDWCEELRLHLNELSQKVDRLTPETLAKNDAFVSAFAQATQAALKTHQAEKREALRNAVLNVAIGSAPSEDLQLIFLNLVDSFTPTHLGVLRDCQAKGHPNRGEFRKQRDLTDQVVCDLRDRGLVRDTRPLAARDRDSPEALVIYDWEITNLGRQFLEFIKVPEMARL